MTFLSESEQLNGSTTGNLPYSDRLVQMDHELSPEGAPVDPELSPEEATSEGDAAVTETNWQDCLDEEVSLEQPEEPTVLESDEREGDVPTDVYKMKTKRTFATSPVVSLLFVVGLTTVALGTTVAIFVLASGAGDLMSSKTASKEVDKGPKSPYATVPEDQQITALKRRVNKKERDAKINAFNRNAAKPPSPTPAPQPKASPPPASRVQPIIPRSSVPKVQPLKVKPLPRSLPVITKPAPKPPPRPPAQVAQPKPAPSPSPKETEDPYAAWERLANLGSTKGDSSASVAAAPQPVAPPDNPAADAESEQDSGVGSFAQDVENASYPQSDSSGGESGISGGQSIPIGTKAKAKLMMPIVWNEGISIGGDTILARLKEPLGDLPKETILSLTVTEQSNNLLRLKVKSASVDGSGRRIPEGVIVGGPGGGPLVAETKGNGKGITLGDVAGVAIAGLSRAASVINQPSQSTTFAADGLSQVVEDNGSRDVLAAVGEGAADRIIATAESRVDDIRESRQPYSKVAEGKTVEIVVTQNITL